MSANSHVRRAVSIVCGMLALAAVLRTLPFADPLAVHLDEALSPPFSNHGLAGTDDLGRDLLSRIALGTSTTLGVSLAGMLVATLFGAIVGAVAGYLADGLIDIFISWVIDLTFSLPFLLVVAAALSVTEPALWKSYAVLAAVMWIQPARVVRAEVIRHRRLTYVLAARSLGVPEWKIVLQRLLPRAARPAVALVTTYLPEIIALEAGLSFLGLGVQPPYPALGRMVFDGLPYLSFAWWLAILPAATLCAIVSAVTIIGRGGWASEAS